MSLTRKSEGSSSVQAILNRAKSTLSQSRQFRQDPSTMKLQLIDEDRDKHPSTTAANYDYESIFKNANANKKSSGRSSFNMFLMSPSQSPTGSQAEGGENLAFLEPPKPKPPLLRRKVEKPGNIGSNVRFQIPIHRIHTTTQEGYHSEGQDDDDQSDSGSEPKESPVNSNYTTSDESEVDGDTTTTITPPTITETSHSKSSRDQQNHLKIVDLEDFEVEDNSPLALKKTKPNLKMGDKLQKQRNRSRHVVIKTLSDAEYSKSSEKQKSKSYTEDFVSEMQSVAEEFSKSVAFAEDADTISSKAVTLDSIEVPVTESSTEKPSSIGNSSKVKNNLVASSRLVAATPAKSKVKDSSESEDEISQQEGMYFAVEGGIVAKSRSASKSFSNNLSSKASLPPAPKIKAESTKLAKAAGAGPDKKKSTNPVKSSSIFLKEGKKGATATSNSKAKLEYPLSSRQSSRKLFQEALSNIQLQNDFTEAELEQVLKYDAPKTKQQTQIHAILEKEIFQKELHRLRRLQLQEEKQEEKIQAIRAKNYRKMQDLQKKGAEVAVLPQEEGDKRPPGKGRDYSSYNYLGMDALGPVELPEEDDNNYLAQVRGMDVPQLVREVMSSNERMYKMTIKAAKQMSKQYKVKSRR